MGLKRDIPAELFEFAERPSDPERASTAFAGCVAEGTLHAGGQAIVGAVCTGGGVLSKN